MERTKKWKINWRKRSSRPDDQLYEVSVGALIGHRGAFGIMEVQEDETLVPQRAGVTRKVVSEDTQSFLARDNSQYLSIHFR